MSDQQAVMPGMIQVITAKQPWDPPPSHQALSFYQIYPGHLECLKPNIPGVDSTWYLRQQVNN